MYEILADFFCEMYLKDTLYKSSAEWLMFDILLEKTLPVPR